jgi:ATP-dependent Clp endopeptidase proteolytic subunit ClpP
MASFNENSIFTIVNKDSQIRSKIEDMIDLPKTVLVNAFTEESAKKFYIDMSEAENSNQDIIPIIIDSYGGQIYSLLSMVDCIRSSKKKIATIGLSKSMSCGSILLSCGAEGFRFISPLSTVLIHDVSSWVIGKALDIKMEEKEVSRLNDLIYKIMDCNCGHEEGYFQKIVHDKKGHADWYLTAEEAVEHKLANHIRIPRFEVNIYVETKFK